MAGFFKKLLDTFNLFTEEDDLDEEYDDYLLEQEEKGHRRLSREAQEPKEAQTRLKPEKRTPVVPAAAGHAAGQKRTGQKEENTYALAADTKAERTFVPRTEKLGSGKVVPIRSTGKGLEVCVMKPSSFEESQDISDVILSNRACVINLEGFDIELAQRVMDFVSGSLYAVNGRLHQISSYIFIVSPESVDISGDYLDLLQQDKFGVPTLNKGF